MMPFRDRSDAGRQLAAELVARRDPDAVVLALPRGGALVAAEVAAALGAPLDVLLVRKLGLPFLPEVAMGAIAEGGLVYRDEEVISACAVTPEQFAEVETEEWRILEAREVELRHGRPRLPIAGRTVIIVDDGIATGATARVACRAARALGAKHLVLAAPVAAPEALRPIVEADEVVCLDTPLDFSSVGGCYLRFGQTSDAEVIDVLDRAAARLRPAH